uniref:Uncharacterized protein n=1 Tax=Oryza sativa subsp. japonica TaxID=39947 RepID=Q5Z6P8_ORYSJ|nr:hypothetical protein [Oryza sativa Japonica Group]BAD54371.1 hypothetical protein [Oryza sativa Japonica Group]
MLEFCGAWDTISFLGKGLLPDGQLVVGHWCDGRVLMVFIWDSDRLPSRDEGTGVQLTIIHCPCHLTFCVVYALKRASPAKPSSSLPFCHRRLAQPTIFPCLVTGVISHRDRQSGDYLIGAQAATSASVGLNAAFSGSDARGGRCDGEHHCSQVRMLPLGGSIKRHAMRAVSHRMTWTVDED